MEAMQKHRLTVVVPFRNIGGQACPLLADGWCSRLQGIRCLLVDDHSEDGSFEAVAVRYAADAHVSVLRSDYPQGKKQALRCAMEHADSEYVMTMDADVYPPLFLFQGGEYADIEADLYILPLVMGNPLRLRELPWLSRLCIRLQQTEYVAIQSLTLLSVEKGHPVMCSGANLIVRRRRWLESYCDLHTELPSGDDMFLLESFKHRGLRIVSLSGRQYAATVLPEISFACLLRQRMRWAGKAPAYKDRDILLCGAIVLVSNLLALFPPFFLSKYFADVWIIRRGRDYGLYLPHLWRNAFVLSLVYPWYVFVSVAGGLLRRRKW